VTTTQVTARELGKRSRAAVEAGDRDGWLALFAEDAVVQDPIGPSPFDRRHRPPGLGAIAKFYDEVVAPSERITFEIERSYLCGDEVATSASSARGWRVAGMSPWCAGVHLPR